MLVPGAGPEWWGSHAGGQGGLVKNHCPTANESQLWDRLSHLTPLAPDFENPTQVSWWLSYLEHNSTSLHAVQPLESSHRIFKWSFPLCELSYTMERTLLVLTLPLAQTTPCCPFSIRAGVAGPSFQILLFVSNSVRINMVYWQAEATKQPHPRKIIPEVSRRWSNSSLLQPDICPPHVGRKNKG